MPTTTPQPIQFLLHQLATNEQNLKNSNSLGKILLKVEDNELLFWTTEHKKGYCKEWWTFNMLSTEHIELFIRTCLSRVNGQAVLGVFEDFPLIQKLKTDKLYEAFDYWIRYGKPLDTALQALHDKMSELVPEYQEFLNL